MKCRDNNTLQIGGIDASFMEKTAMELPFEEWVTFHFKVDTFERYRFMKIMKILSNLKNSASLWNNLFIHDSQS